MPALDPVLAASSANIYYQFARLQSLSEWWHWLVLIGLCLAIAGYVGWMYRKDSVELPRGLAVLLFTLRLLAFLGVLFFFFNLEKRAERKIVKNSRAVLLVDTSQSMGLRDSDSSNVPAAQSRIEQVEQEIARGTLIEKLREKHDVIVSRFDEGENPVEIASYPRKGTKDETSETQQTEQQRLDRMLGEARWTAAIAGVVLGLGLIAGLVYLIAGARPAAGEQTSWALLVSMTLCIAAAVIFAVVSLRMPEIKPLAIVGLAEVKPPEQEASSPGKKDEQQTPQVDWAAQLAPRGSKSRIDDNLKFVIDRERGGPVAGVVLFTDGRVTPGKDCDLAVQAAQDALIPVFPVGLGSDKQPANVRVVDLEARERV